ncbi:WGxxGxxG family protein [Streptomyces sp. NPDC052020]|uniref:WGxxGxxG family protein n=1 Tax=Streptomyces sp. NPDC052020 TaxID=3155677 RepID=UPI003413F616
MRKTAATTLIALLLAVAPAGTAFSQPAERANPTVSTATVQAQDQDDKDDGGGEGLWGLFGLLGLAGLIPWRKNRGRQPRDTHTTGRGTGM